MSIKFYLESIEVQENQVIEFNEDDIVILVGPNNCGKSLSLREMLDDGVTIVKYPEIIGSKIITKREFKKEGSGEQFLEFLNRSEVNTIENDPNYGVFQRGSSDKSVWVDRWNMSNSWPNLKEVKSLLLNWINTESRLLLSNPANSISITTQKPRHPIHILQIDNNLENRFSVYFRKAFGLDLIVHRNAGNQVPLYVGERPMLDKGELPTNRSYYQKIERLERLENQGDGMRAFTGLMLYCFFNFYKILVIDEPETFLHPPQSRLIGQLIALETPKNAQIFVATHSEDFIKGLLSVNSDRIKVIRIDRGMNNRAQFNVLNNNDVVELWKDPILRYSNILNGLFYKKVIICEGDADCQFYSALLDAVTSESEGVSELFFTHCNGKYKMPIVVQALRKLNVPMQVICDFDILREEKPLSEIYEILGGEWKQIREKWKKVKLSIDDKRSQLNRDELKIALSQILDETKGDKVSDKQIKDIKEEMKKSSAWSQAKTTGSSFIPAGEPTQLYEEIREELEKCGLLIVEIGELESFYRYSSNHGPKWVNDVIQLNLKTNPKLKEAREFVKKLL